MRQRRATGGPFGQRLFFTTGEIDDLCREALRATGLLPEKPEAIRIERFVEKHFGGAVLEYKDLGPGVLGCTTFNDRGAVMSVVIGDTNTGSVAGERRLRSTVAHEAGHGLMHASLFIDDGLQREFQGTNVDVGRRRILCRAADVVPVKAKAYDGRWWEWQANRAIGGLLLPKHLVNSALEAILAKTAVTGGGSIPPARRAEAKDLIARTFEVNPVVAEIRLAEMFPLHQQNQLTF